MKAMVFKRCDDSVTLCTESRPWKLVHNPRSNASAFSSAGFLHESESGGTRQPSLQARHHAHQIVANLGTTGPEPGTYRVVEWVGPDHPDAIGDVANAAVWEVVVARPQTPEIQVGGRPLSELRGSGVG